MSQEEKLFRTYGRYLVSQKLNNGSADVGDFLKYSICAQNRRKSRDGHAFENHLEEIFIAHKIKYDRNKVTETNSKPDFIFPGITEYRDSNFPTIQLQMLAVKTTCKDRWRQVLAEANRIEKKHLITLEPSISTTQTDQMVAKKLQLVVPLPLQQTYLPVQQDYLMSLADFLSFLRPTRD